MHTCQQELSVANHINSTYHSHAVQSVLGLVHYQSEATRRLEEQHLLQLNSMNTEFSNQVNPSSPSHLPNSLNPPPSPPAHLSSHSSPLSLSHPLHTLGVPFPPPLFHLYSPSRPMFFSYQIILFCALSCLISNFPRDSF